MCTSQFELFMSERETSRLFGIDAQVYYILKDKFMTHALSSELLINSSYDDHVLSWRNRNPARPISYRLSFVTDYQDAIELPVRLNISSSGLVPTQQSALQMVFNCTGRRPAVRIELNLSLTNMSGNDDITNLSLKRKKLCSVSNSASGPSPNEFGQNFKDSLQFKASTELPGVVSPANIRAKPTSTEIFYVAVGVASAIILLVAVIIFTLVIGSSNHGSGLLRLDGNRNSSLMSLPSSRKGTLSSFSIPPSTSACDIQLSLAPLAINRESVHLGEVLLSGGFGKLYHGVVYVQDETEECYEQKVLIKSASGVCLDQPPLLVYPHSDKGNLKTLLLQSNRVTHHLPVSQLITEQK
ncbi:RYK [Bugula neritina]|uniref:RYK n=1 Tax=Bugula neritina TaxID=10212 RepID=A0A7J7KGG7_BUGNE|nr:RYK [Bugula neritina]